MPDEPELRHYFVRVDGELTQGVRAALRGGLRMDAGWIGIAPEWGARRDWETQEDAEGTPHFRLVVMASRPEQAREQVEKLFANQPQVSVRSIDERPPGGGMQGRYEEIEYRAVEHLVVELMQGYASEQERLSRLRDGREPSIVVTSVAVFGSFPETTLRVRTYDRSRDLEQPNNVALWRNDEFVAAAASMKTLRRWVSEFLMYQRGG